MENGFYKVKTIEEMVKAGGKLFKFNEIDFEIVFETEGCAETYNETMESYLPENRVIKVIDNYWIDKYGDDWHIIEEMVYKLDEEK